MAFPRPYILLYTLYHNQGTGSPVAWLPPFVEVLQDMSIYQLFRKLLTADSIKIILWWYRLANEILNFLELALNTPNDDYTVCDLFNAYKYYTCFAEVSFNAVSKYLLTSCGFGHIMCWKILPHSSKVIKGIIAISTNHLNEGAVVESAFSL